MNLRYRIWPEEWGYTMWNWEIEWQNVHGEWRYHSDGEVYSEEEARARVQKGISNENKKQEADWIEVFPS
jgi:hypothetical protein